MAVVFTDPFTVGSNTNIDAYPSGSPDYAYNEGSGTALLVVDSTDRVERTGSGRATARIIDGAVPTGDQQAQALVRSQASGFESGYVCCRMATSGNLANYYFGYISLGDTNEVELYRRDNGSNTLLADGDRGLTATGNYTMRLRAKGTGSQVDLELQVDATTVVTASDTSGSRKTSGPPGVGAASDGAFVSAVDDLEIDDMLEVLAAAITAAATTTGSLTVAGAATLEQEGYRAVNDDGNEAASTFFAAQDAGWTTAIGITKRIRTIVNATGDPPVESFRQEYRLKGSGESWNILGTE